MILALIVINVLLLGLAGWLIWRNRLIASKLGLVCNLVLESNELHEAKFKATDKEISYIMQLMHHTVDEIVIIKANMPELIPVVHAVETMDGGEEMLLGDII